MPAFTNSLGLRHRVSAEFVNIENLVDVVDYGKFGVLNKFVDYRYVSLGLFGSCVDGMYVTAGQVQGALA